MTHVAPFRQPSPRQLRDNISRLRAQVDTRRSSLLDKLPDYDLVRAFDSMPARLQRYFFQCGPGEALRLIVTFLDDNARESVVWGD